MAFLSKYGVARHIYIPIIKRGVVDFAVSADWTPAGGDVKISKDGGAAANVTNLPAAITMGNTAMWDFSLTATEMQAAQIEVTVADSATKAVEDQAFVIETYGNASAQHVTDLSNANLLANVVQWNTHNVAAENVNGVPKVDLVDWLGSAPNALTSGRVESLVGAMAANTLDSSAVAASAAVEIGGAAWDELRASHTTANTFGEGVNVASILANVITATAIAANALTSAKIAADAIGASQLATDGVQEIRDSVWAKTMTELAGVPAINADVLSALEWIFTLARNKRTQTATTETVLKDDSVTPLAASAKADDGVVFTRSKYA